MSPLTVSTRGAPRLLLRILPPSAVSHGAKPRVRAEMGEIWDIRMFNANSTQYNQESHGYLVCGNPSFNRRTRKWYGSIVATGPAVRRHASQKSHRWRYSPRNLPKYLSVLLCVLPQFRYSGRTIIVKAGHLPQGPLEDYVSDGVFFFTAAMKPAASSPPYKFSCASTAAFMSAHVLVRSWSRARTNARSHASARIALGHWLHHINKFVKNHSW